MTASERCSKIHDLAVFTNEEKRPCYPQNRRQGGGQNTVEKRRISGLRPESSHDYSVV
jgi:hypothetical protein